jgi:hypothetical protein
LLRNPENELEEFLAPLPGWMSRAFEGNYSFSSRDEELEWINNQDKVFGLRPEYERILRLIPTKWNEYCARFQKNWAATTAF